MVIAFAGRRIDAEPSRGPAHFPLANVPRVALEVERFLGEERPAAVVGSAACGADLIVLEAAGRLGIRRLVVLPFARARFRETSVTDRPGDWGGRFDDVVKAAAWAGDLVELSLDPDAPTTYTQANAEIQARAERLAAAGSEPVAALVLWSGRSRGPGDVTEAFRRGAERRGWPTRDILTVDAAQPAAR